MNFPDEDGLIRRAQRNYHRALKEQSRVRLPDAGWRWAAYCIEARKIIDDVRSIEGAIHPLQTANGGFEARIVADKLPEYAGFHDNHFAQVFPQFADAIGSFSDVPFSHKSTTTEVNGRLVGSPLYNHIGHILRCLSFNRPDRVLEIGGGYGAPGRLWLTNGAHKAKQYVDVDFPESLFYAELYLSAVLPEARIQYLTRQAIPDPAADIILCPIASLPALNGQAFDLILNTGSLQEMTDAYVSLYMDWIDHAKCDRFYSSNYFCQPIDQLMESMNVAAPVMPKGWSMAFSALAESPTRSVAELYFVRADEPAPALSIPEPLSATQFLATFDAARQSTDADALLQLARAATEMPFVPKEALWLTRQAMTLGHADLPLLSRLEAMSASGRDRMGIVEASAENTRARLSKGEFVAKNRIKNWLRRNLPAPVLRAIRAVRR